MIRDVFNRTAQTYDRARRQLIPCFDDFYEAVLDGIATLGGGAVRVLDLGAGTGLLSALIAERFPAARFVLIDLAEEMLGRARARFAGEQAGRFEFVHGDFTRELPAGPFDAVVSAMAIHHLSDEAKADLYRRAHAALRPGGVFVNADQVLGPTPALEDAYGRHWLRMVRARGVSEQDLAAAQMRMREDRMATLAAQLDWLEAAGFAEVDCAYKQYRFAVFGGVRR